MLTGLRRSADAHLFRLSAALTRERGAKIKAIGFPFGTAPASEEEHDERKHRIRVAHDPASARP